MYTSSPQPPSLILPCSPADETVKAFQPELEFTSYKIPLRESFLLKNLTSEQLGDVCQSNTKYGFYFASSALEALREKFKPENLRLQTASLTEEDEGMKKSFDLYLSNPPPLVAAKEFDSARWNLTSMAFSPEEAALVRYVLEDPAAPPESSLLRRIGNPLHKGDEKFERYAFSVTVDSAQYDKIIAYLSFFDGAGVEVSARAKLITGEIMDLKKQISGREAPPKPLVIPDSFFAERTEIPLLRQKISAFQKTPPAAINDKTNLDDYVLIRENLFPADVAFLRYLIGDTGSNILTAYFPDPPDGHTPRPYYIRRNVDWQKLIDGLSIAQNACEQERQDPTRCQRAEMLRRESERLQRKIQDESKWYQFSQHGLPIGYAFVFAGATVTAVLKGPAFVRWVIEKTKKGPPSPPTSGGAIYGLPDSTSVSGPPDIRFIKAAKMLAWGLATVGAAALTLTSGAATLVTIEIPGVDAAAATATVYSAGLTATAAMAFYLSSQIFLKSAFEAQ